MGLPNYADVGIHGKSLLVHRRSDHRAHMLLESILNNPMRYLGHRKPRENIFVYEEVLFMSFVPAPTQLG